MFNFIKIWKAKRAIKQVQKEDGLPKKVRYVGTQWRNGKPFGKTYIYGLVFGDSKAQVRRLIFQKHKDTSLSDWDIVTEAEYIAGVNVHKMKK